MQEIGGEYRKLCNAMFVINCGASTILLPVMQLGVGFLLRLGVFRCVKDVLSGR